MGNFGFIIDKPNNIDIAHDSSLKIISALNSRTGCNVYIADYTSLSLHDRTVGAEWQRCSYHDGDDYAGSLSYPDSPLADDIMMSAILMRKDPPVDLSYINALHILAESQTPVLNNPTVLLTMPEKLIPLHGPYAVPDSYITSDTGLLRSIINNSNHEWVLKPTNDCGGRNVFIVDKEYANLSYLIDNVTSGGTSQALIQRFLPEVTNGDKRILILDGVPIGWMNRVPAHGEFRANIHLGATPYQFDLTNHDIDICSWVSSVLPSRQAPLIAIDIIGKYLTEVNITSPSGIPEINAVTGLKLEELIADFLINNYGS